MADYTATPELRLAACRPVWAAWSSVVMWCRGRGAMQVSLASDLMWNWKAKEATASFGYDYMLRQCRLRGRIDSEGKVTSLRCRPVLDQRAMIKSSLHWLTQSNSN